MVHGGLHPIPGYLSRHALTPDPYVSIVQAARIWKLCELAGNNELQAGGWPLTGLPGVLHGTSGANEYSLLSRTAGTIKGQG